MSKIQTIVQITFEYDTETQETVVISKEIVGESTAKPKTKKTTSKSKVSSEKIDNNLGVIREDGKLILSEDTIELLGASVGDKIFIGYDKVGSKFKPFIGVDEKKGNKLTNSLTVSYRGKSNDELAYYGSEFILQPGKINGTFYLVGNKEDSEVEDHGIVVDEDDISVDIPFTSDLEDVPNRKQITSFTFDDIEL